MSRGSETIETVLPTGSSDATIIVSVSELVDADQEDVDPFAVLRDGCRRGDDPLLAGRRLEDPREGVAHQRAVAPDGDVRQDDEERDDDDADDAETADPSSARGIEERLADGQKPPREQDHVEGQQRTEDLRRDDPRSEPSR